VIQDATLGNQALAERITAEDHRRRQEARELKEWQDPRVRYQHELDRWWQSKLDVEAELRANRVSGFHDPMARFEQETKDEGNG
jgi:hypothetical protein